MKHILLTTIAAVLVVGCGPSEADRALLDAARKGNIEAVKQHLDAGADMNAKNKYGSTPLEIATVLENKEVLELLIAEGADVNAKFDDVGTTPLHTAARYGHKETAELLIAKGADVNAQSKYVGTPLHQSVRYARPIIIAELLIAAGADVNAKDNSGYTPLHRAALCDHKEIGELLIANGADVNAKDIDGKTPLNSAEGETADLLRKHGGKTGEELNTPSRRSQAAGTRAPVLSQKNARPKSFPKTTKELMFGANPTLTDKDKAFCPLPRKGNLMK